MSEHGRTTPAEGHPATPARRTAPAAPAAHISPTPAALITPATAADAAGPAGQAGEPEPVTLLFDVRSPWCYQTSRWLRRLAERGEVTLNFGVFSLEVVNLHADEDPAAYDAEFGPALRVALALREHHGQRAIGDFYAAFGTRMWETPAPAGEPLPDVPELTRLALADIGIAPGYAGQVLADPATWSAVLAEHRHWARRLRVFGVPTLVFGDADRDPGPDVIFGPVLQHRPADDDGLALWRHLRGLARLGTLYELKRYKSLHSRAGLPNAVPRADLRVTDMRAARALMGDGGPHAGASLEWAMSQVRAERAGIDAARRATATATAAEAERAGVAQGQRATAAEAQQPTAGEAQRTAAGREA